MLKNQKPIKPQAKITVANDKNANKPKGKKQVEVKSNKWLHLAIAAALAIITIISFSSCFDNELTNWDDPDYILDNPIIRNLDGATVKEIFTKPYFGNYQPLHILSYAIEFHYWKLDPKGYHVLSTILFAITVMLVFYFALSLTSGNVIIATIAAALFGLNAMHVESVAWAAERKDTLYSLFFVASLIYYIKYIKSELKWHHLFFAFVLFVLSLLSKVMAVSLVGVLIMLDYWYDRKLSVRLVIEKILFVIPSVIIGIIQVKSVDQAGTIAKGGSFNFVDKISIACHNLLQYFVKLIAPINLSAFYPYPTLETGKLPWDFYASPIVVILLGAAVIYSMRYTKIFFFAAGFFVACIALVLQYLPVGPTMFSERYTLVPAIAFSFLLAYGVNVIIQKWPAMKMPALIVSAVYCAVLAVGTYNRCNVWQTSLTLWDNVLEQFPTVATALNNRGKYYGQVLANYQQAETDLTNSIKADPNYELAYSNRGIVYSITKRYDKALADFDMAIKLKPDYAEAMHNRAIAYSQIGKVQESLKDLNYLVEKHPNSAENWHTRGVTFLQLNQAQKGLDDINRALSINPELAQAYASRVQANYMLGRIADAKRDLQMCNQLGVQINPELANKVNAAN
ncbi:MAG TPA: tetratricopeptide repeat protein [Bacteroidia bacterium]|nr:tetratricopeptide repeat protein [Bacteroidia bacterium]